MWEDEAPAEPMGLKTKPSFGFTFLEVILALGVAVLMVTALSHALIAVFRAEQTADRLIEGKLLLWTLAAAEHAGLETDALNVQSPSGWRTESEIVILGAGSETCVWKVVRCASPEVPLQTAFRQ